jgi:hypothetical protein
MTLLAPAPAPDSLPGRERQAARREQEDGRRQRDHGRRHRCVENDVVHGAATLTGFDGAAAVRAGARCEDRI